MNEDHEWERYANCLGLQPSAMFPERGDMAGWREAKAICRACDVRQSCLEAHIEEIYGCFGGTSPIERQRLRGERLRVRRTAGHGTRARYQSGCRCEGCREANADYGRSRRWA